MDRKCLQRKWKWNCRHVFLLTLFPVCLLARGMGDEQRLMEGLLTGYNTAARPVFNAAHIVNVKFGLTLIHISDMDEVNQVLTINVWLEQEWQDERLVWDPRHYNGLKILRIPCEKIWLPDIVLYNSADDYTAGYMNSKAMVTSSGNVFWPPPAKFRSSCKIDITYFPFDDQVCELKFGSWTYDGFQVDITNRSAQVDLTNYVFSGEWELIDVRVRRTEMYYACCEEPYPDVRFTIIIRRKTLYYLFNIIFPCLWLTILSLLGFWLPPDSGEKITLGITVLLAFSVFMLLIAESMPATSEFVPLIGIYLTVTMAMTSLSIILTVFVLQLHHVGPHQKRVPRWVWTLVVDILAPLVCLCHIHYHYRYLNTRLQSHTPPGRKIPPQQEPVPGQKVPPAASHNHANNAGSNWNTSPVTVTCHAAEGKEQKDQLLNSSAGGFVSSLGGEGRGAITCNGAVVSKHVSAAVQTSVRCINVPRNIQVQVPENLTQSAYCWEQERLGLDDRRAIMKGTAFSTSSVSVPPYDRPQIYHPQNIKADNGLKLNSPLEILGPPASNVWKISEECFNACPQSNGSICSPCSAKGVAGGFIGCGSCDVTRTVSQGTTTGEGPLSPSSDSSLNHVRHAHIHQVVMRDKPQAMGHEGPAVLCTNRLCLQRARTNSSPDLVLPQPPMMAKQSASCVQGLRPDSCRQTCVKREGAGKNEDILSLGMRKDFRATFSISEGLSSTLSRLSSGSSHAVCELTIEDSEIIPHRPSNKPCATDGDRDVADEETAQPMAMRSQKSQTDHHQDIVTEWRVVAHVMDRLLFWFFLLISVVSSVLILIVKPITKPEEWRKG